jgi:hypothetical protein
MTSHRWDETWHRLREWTADQGPSERLAAQVLVAEGFSSLDPSHPLGGKDGGKDATCSRNGEAWIMAVYFPRGQQSFAAVRKKYLGDARGAKAAGAAGIAFVTNQELMLAERRDLAEACPELQLELYHLERLTTLLDGPALAATRKQFLGIDYLEEDAALQVARLRAEMVAVQKRIEGVQLGGNSFCYFMLYHFDLKLEIAQNLAVIRKGEFPLYDLRIRVMDLHANRDVFEKDWGELNSPADILLCRWPLPLNAYYQIFFHARNGGWHQDLILRKSETAEGWLAATRVWGQNSRDVVFTHTDNGFELEFGTPAWQS